MKMTLLEMVQDIANDLNTEEVNSISDTVEAAQIAQVIRTTYYEFITNKQLPAFKKLTKLVNLSDVTKPNYLRIPENVRKVEFVNFNKKLLSTDKDMFEELEYVYPDEFIRRVNGRDSTDDNIVRVEDFDGVPLLIMNDKAPDFYTSFDDEYVVFDSYVEDIGSTLLESYSQAQVLYTPSWTVDDDFVPDLPVEAFPGLLAEAKSTAFLVIKQMANEKAEQQSKRQRSAINQRGWKVGGHARYPDYGRRSSK